MPRGRVSAVRSRIMAAIRGKDTKPEMLVRRAVHAAGFRYRLHQGDLPGRPDLVLTRLKTVVFVHGCFWHHHDCVKSKWPKTRAAFWRKKIEANQARDIRTTYFLRTAGWHVEVIWECELKREVAIRRLIRKLERRRAAADADD
jgi:DNA mismatch endonuclease, patch repair protein